MHISLNSKTLQMYYGKTPYSYDLNFINYNIIVVEDNTTEYNLLAKDIENIKSALGNNFLLYFSDITNLKKLSTNTDIVNKYTEYVYLRIRNSNEYINYTKLSKKVNLIIQLRDLQKINISEDENIVIQIDDITELPIELLDKLLLRYNIKKILLGQIAYLTEKDSYLLDILSSMFNIDKLNQLELEKNNKITNDIYFIDTYKNIYQKVLNILDNLKSDNKIKTLKSIYDYIAKNVTYDDNDNLTININNHNLIGPLFYNKSVCEGYSKLFYQFCCLLNFESIIVSGGERKEKGGHIWNQVNIDEIWYNVDVTARFICNT